MPFDWGDFLDLARRLADNENSEADLRSAISRAYYAAFHKARTQLIIEGEVLPKDGTAHDFVWRRYRNAPGQIRNSIGINLERLKKKRTDADYRDSVSSLPSVVKVALSESDIVIRQVSEIAK